MEFKPLDKEKNETNLITLLSENQEEEKKIPAEENIPFSLALYDNDLYIGGITANKWMNATHISLLAVNKNDRGKGYGSQLLKRAEEFAIETDSALITINTQDYQAKSFYEKLGYQVFGKLEDTPFIGTTKYYLVKQL
ncbi:GNAT family N-acetyltransferase [Enterococcus quebecensis]|uniref:GNAT family N-acetyltransferase n=1 Tax=Enterococcus quebecensis TaxID=903983 RepID=A0A1E5H461_9ENTE|nr:GNAT family N-acetyltransferase [Enterococcus quebecensis]